MAQAIKVKKRRLKCAAIAEQFVLSQPEKMKGRNGKMYDIFHRFGASGGAPTNRELMQKEGMMKELADAERDANKRYRSLEEARGVVKSREVHLKQILNGRISAFKQSLHREYASQKLIPLVARVRIHSKDDERRLFIQGWADEKGELVIGNRDDGALWAIENLANTRGFVKINRLANMVGRDLVARGLSAPVKERLSLFLK